MVHSVVWCGVSGGREGRGGGRNGRNFRPPRATRQAVEVHHTTGQHNCVATHQIDMGAEAVAN